MLKSQVPRTPFEMVNKPLGEFARRQSEKPQTKKKQINNSFDINKCALHQILPEDVRIFISAFAMRSFEVHVLHEGLLRLSSEL